MVRNEAFLFPIWLAYYQRFFGPEDIYVLDHQTSDGSTDGDGFQRIMVDHPRMDAAWMRDMLEHHQHDLIRRYDVVAIADVDEWLVPDPEVGDLGQYLDDFDAPFANTRGREIGQHPSEHAYDPTLPIFEQRRYWFSNSIYSKPVVAREPMHWVPGLHARSDYQTARDENLYLVHLHRLDHDECRRRHLIRSAMDWHDQDISENWGTHNLITAEDEFDRWFYGSRTAFVEGWLDNPIEWEEIPSRFRSVG